MKKSFFSRAIAYVLVALMCITSIPVTAFAAEVDTTVSGDYYKVVSNNQYALAPGATESEIVVNNAEGSDRKVVHVFEVDAKNENVEILPGYYGIDKLDPDNLALEGVEDKAPYWQAKELTKTVNYYENMGYNVVGAMNTALAYDSNAPYGYMVMDGVVLGTPEVHKGAQTYLAIDGEGNCELRDMATPLKGNEVTAISANFGWLVKDGKLTSTSVERTSSDASRSMIGIKADGSLVFCQVDGRNAPVSTGLSNYEMGEMMLSLGCVNAVNCDGGGSSTFVSKREGETANTMRSIPSDGSERPTINSVIIASKAKATGEFHHAVLSADYNYYAPGTSATITAVGVDAAGSPAELPSEGITWSVSDDSMGSVSNGVFTSAGKKGNVTVKMHYNDSVVGEKIINIVHPDEFKLALDETVLPYGKSMQVEFDCRYGEDNWSVCVDGAYELELSNDKAASLEGNTLTATTDETITSVDVTATYLPDSNKKDVLKVSFGKGSEVLYDFENGNVNNFLGVDEMFDWAEETGASAPIQSNGNFSNNTDSETFLATVENGGKVRNGANALGVTLDYTAAEFASWSYNMFFHVGEPVVLRDVANGKNATTFGMWAYIPEGAAGLAMQLTVYQGKSADTATGTQHHFYFTTATGAKKNLNSCTEEDIPESRWVYATADISAADYVSLVDPYGTKYGREPSFIRFYVKPMKPAKLDFYFDDFTLDYSSAVDDRVLPQITAPTYTTSDTGVSLENGITIPGTSVAFSANHSDNIAVDTTRGGIYVDGLKLENVTISNKNISSENVTLLPGKHTVAFEVYDKMGNLGKVTRTFTIAGDEVISLGGHNDSGEKAEYGSVYYLDINSKDISAVDKLTATLKLQTANTWELEGAIVAEGFDATFDYNEISKLLTVSVDRVGKIKQTKNVNNTLVSIPVRVWTWNGKNHVTDTVITPESQFATGYCPVVNIDCKVVKGSVKLNDSEVESTFGGSIDAETKVNDTVYPWHYHDEELTVLNEEATCTKAGYENRTYCETCKSVVDFGTIIDAKGHTYTIVEDKLTCECGDFVKGSGVVEVNDKLYCLISDKIVTGWQAVENGWCYADPSTKEVVVGDKKIEGITYTFNEAGTLVKGVWVKDSKGTKYSYGPGFYTRTWQEIDGDKYYFGTDSYIYTGIKSIPVNRNNLSEGIYWYEFAEDGKYIKDATDLTGIYEYNGKPWYVKDGKNYYGGLMYIDGYYYYARTSGEIVVNRGYGTSKTSCELPNGYYTFDEQGRMINPPVVKPEEPDTPTVPDTPVEKKNGVCADENGKLWYYVDDVKTYGGLMYIDGYYYYARTSGEIVVNRSYGTSKTSCELPNGYYTFDEQGRMINPPTVKNNN